MHGNLWQPSNAGHCGGTLSTRQCVLVYHDGGFLGKPHTQYGYHVTMLQWGVKHVETNSSNAPV